VTERELVRNAVRRLAIIRHAEEVTGNVAKTCRYFGITRQSYYVWLRRYYEEGLGGLRGRSSRPQVSPNATKNEVVGKIMYLRQHYHFGPTKIVSAHEISSGRRRFRGTLTSPPSLRS
jgi:transposase-like protein